MKIDAALRFLLQVESALGGRIGRPSLLAERETHSMSFPIEWANFVPKPRPLTSGDKYHVFLSYRSVNRAWVLNLYDVLRAHGHEVFLDHACLRPETH
jgi:hypothetical protein